MDYAAYNALSDADKKPLQVARKCDCGEPLVGMEGHSIGALHAVCPKCQMCPDCEEGNV